MAQRFNTAVCENRPNKLTQWGRWSLFFWYRGHRDGDRFYRTRGWYHFDGWSN